MAQLPCAVPGVEAGASRVDHLAAMVRHLGGEVRTTEARQVALDQRLAEYGALLHTLQEEQHARACMFEHHQKTLALGAERALQTAVTVQRRVEQEGEMQSCMDALGLDRPGSERVADLEKRWEARFDQQRRWLMELTADLTAVTDVPEGAAVQHRINVDKWEARGVAAEDPAKPFKFEDRIAALEQGQKAIAVSAKRALHTAIVVNDKVDRRGGGKEVAPAAAADGAAKPIAELELQCSARFAEQEERLDRVLHMVNVLADKIAGEPWRQQDGGGGGAAAMGRPPLPGLLGAPAGAFDELRERLADVEAQLCDLAVQPPRPGHGAADEGLHAAGVAAGGAEARVDRSLTEVCQRLDVLQDAGDQQRLALRQIGAQLPEVAQKLDQLWAQCHQCFPRIREHDVHISFFRTSLENHKQQVLDLADQLEGGRSAQPAMGAGAVGTPVHGGYVPPPADFEGAELASRARALAQVMERFCEEPVGGGEAMHWTGTLGVNG